MFACVCVAVCFELHNEEMWRVDWLDFNVRRPTDVGT
jgi:hypothetical protein